MAGDFRIDIEDYINLRYIKAVNLFTPNALTTQ